MSRIQLLLFGFFLATSFILLILNQNIDIYLTNRLSQILLFPLRVISDYLQYLHVSQKKIDYLESELSKIQCENHFLRYQLILSNSKDTIPFLNLKMVKAIIIGRDPTNFNGFLYINKGTKDGLCVNNPVIIQDKLIGRIKSVSENTAIVETIENDGFAVSGMDSRTGVFGIVKKNKELSFEYIKHNDEVYCGDSVYTSGLSEKFPRGILIGTICEVKKTDDLFFKKVLIQPAVRINKLYYAYVIY
uniref:Cell shape-determining protein MreC n=1 Tax=candidate division WOR-3 bacterium TaxID=2052148 RepID=A0A7C4XAI6_UNCW3